MTLARGIAKGIGAGVASAVTRGQGGGAAALDIRAQVGTSTSPTATGTRAVTGVGFTPKVVLPWGIDNTPDGAAVQALLGLGAMTGSAQSAIAVSSRNAQTTSATNRRHAADAVISSLTSIGGANKIAARSSLDSDGFTLNWSTVSGAADIWNHICLGGADLEVSLTQQQMNGTNAAQSFAHGLSGAPTGVLFFGINIPTVPPVTTTAGIMTIGAWAGSNQFSASVRSGNAVTTTATTRYFATTSCLSSMFTGGLVRAMAVSSVDAANVNVTYPTTGDTTQNYFWMLAIRGAKCQVGTFNTASSNTIVTTGLTPKLFIPVFIPSGVASAGSVLNDLCLSIGASDGTNNVSCGISDANAVTTTNARRFQSSTTLQERNTAGTVQFEATAAFSGESIVVTPTTSNTNFGQAGYLALGI